MTVETLRQATGVLLGGRVVLIEGDPGSGKTSLALALIDSGGTLVGDDGVRLSLRGGQVWAAPPPNTAGLIEVRGLGIAGQPHTAAPVALAFDLGSRPERLPVPAAGTIAKQRLVWVRIA